MKRTTYILMGLLVSGLLVIVITIIVMSMPNQGRPSDGIALGVERTELDIKGVHVIKMVVNQGKDQEKRKVFINHGKVAIVPSLTSGKNRISYPKSQNLNVSQKKDTLLVELDLNAHNVPSDVWSADPFFVFGLDMQLSVDSLTTIMSTMEGVKFDLKEIQTDSLFVRIDRQEVFLDSCQFRSFDIAGAAGMSFQAKNSKIDNFYLDLDGVWRWSFENSVIGVEYLTGSGSNNATNIQKGECDRVIWTPKSDDANLRITVREKAELKIISE